MNMKRRRHFLQRFQTVLLTPSYGSPKWGQEKSASGEKPSKNPLAFSTLGLPGLGNAEDSRLRPAPRNLRGNRTTRSGGKLDLGASSSQRINQTNPARNTTTHKLKIACREQSAQVRGRFLRRGAQSRTYLTTRPLLDLASPRIAVRPPVLWSKARFEKEPCADMMRRKARVAQDCAN